jgi:hypothetical protein
MYDSQGQILAHVRQPRPDSSFGFQVKGLTTVEGVPSLLGFGMLEERGRTRHLRGEAHPAPCVPGHIVDPGRYSASRVCVGGGGGRQSPSSKYGTHDTVKARLWPWLSGESH